MEQLLLVTSTVPASGGQAAALILDVLAAACSAGEVSLIGSMAKPEEADVFSDIESDGPSRPDRHLGNYGHCAGRCWSTTSTDAIPSRAAAARSSTAAACNPARGAPNERMLDV